MASDRSIDLLRRLSLAAGPPGAEDEVRAIVREALGGIGPIDHDRLGSLVCEVAGASAEPRVVLDSHLDEVAFLVQSVSDLGLLSLVPLGRWWGHVLLGQRVQILRAGGARVPGVIGAKPPHLLGAEERRSVVEVDEMFVDVGASTRGEVEELGIAVGDAVVPASEFRSMAVAGVVSGKALDDRAGVALMCEALLDLAGSAHPNTVVGVAAVQEEVGARGAATATGLARPDVAIILECAPADDLPGSTVRQGALGRGPQVRFSDPSAISSRRLVRLVEGVAREREIPIQLAVRRSGGTDAAAIQRHGRGVPTVVIAVPARYIHSHVALLQMADYERALELVIEVVRRLDRNAVNGLVEFGGEIR